MKASHSILFWMYTFYIFWHSVSISSIWSPNYTARIRREWWGRSWEWAGLRWVRWGPARPRRTDKYRCTSPPKSTVWSTSIHTGTNFSSVLRSRIWFRISISIYRTCRNRRSVLWNQTTSINVNTWEKKSRMRRRMLTMRKRATVIMRSAWKLAMAAWWFALLNCWSFVSIWA